MNYEEPIEHIENDVLTIGVAGDDGRYLLWQKGLTPETGSEDGVYFEFNDQINGGYEIIQTCTVTNEGIAVVLANGKSEHFCFPKGFDKLSELKAGLNKVYQNKKSPVKFCI